MAGNIQLFQLEDDKKKRMIRMKRKGKFILSGISLFLFCVLIVLVRFVDVRSIGPENTSVGLSHLNQFFSGLTGFNTLWYKITTWLGYAVILVGAMLAAAGFVQIIKRKNPLKADREIIALGGLYILMMGVYALFEIVVINYRPVILLKDIHPAASFPSSHTVLACVIMGSAVMLIGKYVKKKSLCRLLQTACIALMAVTVLGRLISGVHWFTDILGGILISTALLELYSGIIEKKSETIKPEAD